MASSHARLSARHIDFPRRAARLTLTAAFAALATASAALAQDNDLPPMADAVGPVGPVGNGSAASTTQGGGDMSFFYIVLLVLGGLMLFTILTSRKEKKRREALLSGVRKHDRVQTVGGIIGSVVEVKPDTIVLKVDEASNTRMTFARSAVQQVLKESSEPREANEKS